MEENEPNGSQSLSLRLRRDAGGFVGSFRSSWRKRWFRIGAYALVGLLVLWLLVWALFARNLPSADSLLTYKPPLPSYVRDMEGTPIHSFARERRIELRYDEYPPLLVRAFLAAEDRTFFEHGGLDYPGILGAIFDYVTKLGSGERAKGGSTITQQVAKNLLLGNEYSVTRKVKEAILARRIESVLTKQQIMELYLNQIPLGRNSYGVQAASLAYFNKDVSQLTLEEMAFLAILPKAPETYGRAKNAARALERRNFVLSEMVRNDFIEEGAYQTASAQPLKITDRAPQVASDKAGYFLEEVRRQLIGRFGESEKQGPYSVYSGGLWVRTSLNPTMQNYAEDALRNGLMRFPGRSWMGPIRTIKVGPGWAQRLSAENLNAGMPDWRIAVMLAKAPTAARIGFADGKEGILPSWGATQARKGTNLSAFATMKPGDIFAVKAEGDAWTLRVIPEISGGFVAQDPQTGRVLAMQGGWDVSLASYNRATQAERQPGSSFKPFVYAAALDAGMTPASIIVDGPFCVYQSAKLGRKCFRNFGGGAGAGPQTMRWGLEQSRNLMTVRAASQSGMDKVVKLAAAAGISKPGKDYLPVLAVSLGSGETTVMDMVNAYSVLSQNGRERRPTLIDFVQDRDGKVRYRADTRPCEGCNKADWDGKPMPRPPARTKQMIDPLSSYQVVNMLEGVIKRGTATQLLKLRRPIFGKTGTTTGPTNVWFVGGSAQLTAGVYMGYDQPRPMGGFAQGGTLAVPIFNDFASKAMKDDPVLPFRAPAGIRMIRVDRSSGKRVFGAWPGFDPKSSVIWEAFKADSEPRRSIRKDEIKGAKKSASDRPRARASGSRAAGGNNRSSGAGRGADRPGQDNGGNRRPSNAGDSDFLQRQGGIY
jgi:penicillin-binding protein 1A